MKIPTKLKINGKVWKIINDYREIDTEKYLGLCYHDTREIFLNSKLSRNKLEEVFIHEYLHALFPEGVISGPKEEIIVEALAKGLHRSMRSSGLKISTFKKKT